MNVPSSLRSQPLRLRRKVRGARKAIPVSQLSGHGVSEDSLAKTGETEKTASAYPDAMAAMGLMAKTVLVFAMLLIWAMGFSELRSLMAL